MVRYMIFKGFPYYLGAIATTKCIRAILFVFVPGKTEIGLPWILVLDGLGTWEDFTRAGHIHFC